MNRKHQPVFKGEISLEEIRHVRDFASGLRWLYETGIQGGEKTGWASLDRYYTVRAREWTLITGIPGHGKTVFLDNLMLNLAQFSMWNWAIFSAENLPLERHVATLMSQFIGRPFGPGWRQRINEEEFAIAQAFMDDHFTFLQPREDACTLDRILDLAGALAEHDSGIQGLVIDPWNELEHLRPAGLTETEYVSQALTKLRRWARAHEVHVFLVAHPTKLQRVKASGTEAQVYPVPTPYDVSGSAHWRNKADNCLCVWRDVAEESRAPTQIHIQKVRFPEVGRVGMCELWFDRPTAQFVDGPSREPRIYQKKTMADLNRLVSLINKPPREPGSDDE